MPQNRIVWGHLRVIGLGERDTLAKQAFVTEHDARFSTKFNTHLNNRHLQNCPTTITYVIMADLWVYDDGGPKVDDPTKNPRDLITQSIISVAFGLAAFLTFCVILPASIMYWFNSLTKTITLVAPTEMDWPICSTQKAEECRVEVTRLAGLFRWLDTGIA